MLAGGGGWGGDWLRRALDAHPRADRVHLPGYVSRETARALLRHAEAVVLASEEEGFGLPLAEALACGAPCAISDEAALAEVAGGCARVFRRGDAAGLAGGAGAYARGRPAPPARAEPRPRPAVDLGRACRRLGLPPRGAAALHLATLLSEEWACRLLRQAPNPPFSPTPCCAAGPCRAGGRVECRRCDGWGSMRASWPTSASAPTSRGCWGRWRGWTLRWTSPCS
ncbi:MAG: glycosyltransferase [Thermoanaerobaculaceae bacterium]